MLTLNTGPLKPSTAARSAKAKGLDSLTTSSKAPGVFAYYVSMKTD